MKVLKRPKIFPYSKAKFKNEVIKFLENLETVKIDNKEFYVVILEAVEDESKFTYELFISFQLINSAENPSFQSANIKNLIRVRKDFNKRVFKKRQPIDEDEIQKFIFSFTNHYSIDQNVELFKKITKDLYETEEELENENLYFQNRVLNPPSLEERTKKSEFAAKEEKSFNDKIHKTDKKTRPFWSDWALPTLAKSSILIIALVIIGFIGIPKIQNELSFIEMIIVFTILSLVIETIFAIFRKK